MPGIHGWRMAASTVIRGSAAAARVVSIEKLVGLLLLLLLLVLVTGLLLILHDLLLSLQLSSEGRLLTLAGLERPRC